MKLDILPQAEAEILAEVRWYERRLPGLGDQFLDVVKLGMKRIIAAPTSFARLSAARAKREVRRLRLPRFPFMIVFEVQPERIVVLAVAHFRRRPGYWKRRKG